MLLGALFLQSGLVAVRPWNVRGWSEPVLRERRSGSHGDADGDPFRVPRTKDMPKLHGFA